MLNNLFIMIYNLFTTIHNLFTTVHNLFTIVKYKEKFEIEIDNLNKKWT